MHQSFYHKNSSSGGEMSAEHAGTRKWSKIIKSHSNSSSKIENDNKQQVRLSV